MIRPWGRLVIPCTFLLPSPLRSCLGPLPAWHCAKPFIFHLPGNVLEISKNFHLLIPITTYEEGTIINPILQMRRLRCREAKSSA